MNLDDRELLARTIMAEAGGEGRNGMLAAGAVMANRRGGSKPWRDVIMAPGQFSAWNGVTGYAGGEGAIDMGRLTPSAEAYAVADEIMSGRYTDPTGGATHYYNPAVANPRWGQSAGGEWQRIGNHVFGSAGGYPTGAPRGGFGTAAPGAGNGITMSTKGAPAMEPFVERQSLIRQLIGGEGLRGKTAGIISPLEGANPRLEQERFSGKARRLAEIAALQGAQMSGARGPVSPLQVLAGALASGGETMMTGAAERAGATRDNQLQEMIASGNMSPEVLARITALDPEYGQTLTREEQARQQRMTEMQAQNDFTLSRDQAQREHEIAMAALEPTDRTAMERQLIAAGYDPNGPVDPNTGLNAFQMKMREMLSKEGGSSQPTMRVVLGPDGKPVAVEMGPTVPGETAGGTVPGPAAIPQGGSIGVSELGKVGEGMARTTTPEGAIVDTPIPGSDVALERDAAAETARIAEQTQNVSALNVLTSIDQALENVSWSSTGAVGQALRGARLGEFGLDHANIESSLATVAANLGFDRLTQMRAASPTGAALGNITERELELLQSTVRNLNPKQDAAQLRENLEYIKMVYDVLGNTNPSNPESIRKYNELAAKYGFSFEDRGAPVTTNPGIGQGVELYGLSPEGGGSQASATIGAPVQPIGQATAPAPNVGTPTPAAPVPQAQPTQTQGTNGQPVSVNSKAEVDALPSGTRFVGPDGVPRIKP